MISDFLAKQEIFGNITSGAISAILGPLRPWMRKKRATELGADNSDNNGGYLPDAKPGDVDTPRENSPAIA